MTREDLTRTGKRRHGIAINICLTSCSMKRGSVCSAFFGEGGCAARAAASSCLSNAACNGQRLAENADAQNRCKPTPGAFHLQNSVRNHWDNKMACSHCPEIVLMPYANCKP